MIHVRTVYGCALNHMSFPPISVGLVRWVRSWRYCALIVARPGRHRPPGTSPRFPRAPCGGTTRPHSSPPSTYSCSLGASGSAASSQTPTPTHRYITTRYKVYLCCFFRCFFHRSNSALHRRSSIEILFRPSGYLL